MSQRLGALVNLDAMRFHLIEDCPDRFFIITKVHQPVDTIAIDLYLLNMTVLGTGSQGKKIRQHFDLKREFAEERNIFIWKYKKFADKWEIVYYHFLTSEALEEEYKKFLLSKDKYIGTLNVR
jgi:hypothetical protein